MTALAAAARRRVRNKGIQTDFEPVVGTGATIWAGALVSVDTATGRAVAGSAIAARKFLGLAVETKTGNTGGTVRVKLISNVEVLLAPAAALTTARIGSNACIDDDNTVTTLTDSGTAAARVRVGRVTEFEDSLVWVHLNSFSEADV